MADQNDPFNRSNQIPMPIDPTVRQRSAAQFEAHCLKIECRDSVL